MNRTLILLPLALATALAGTVSARDLPVSPYAGEQQRALKALSPADVSDLRAGNGMGLSKVAELNRYPGPRHVLELAAALELTEAQTRDVEQIRAAMQQEAQRLGEQVLAKETELEGLFTARAADEAKVRALISEIGTLHGRLRFTHVQAHLATTRLLSAAQVAAYDRLRGYAGGTPPARHHRH